MPWKEITQTEQGRRSTITSLCEASNIITGCFDILARKAIAVRGCRQQIWDPQRSIQTRKARCTPVGASRLRLYSLGSQCSPTSPASCTVSGWYAFAGSPVGRIMINRS